MDVERVLRIGYFDHIKVNGCIEPVYDSNGIKIIEGESFRDALDNSDEAFKNGVAKLKITLYGESNTDTSISNLLYMRTEREKLGLTKVDTDSHIDETDKYVIAYINILIIKSDYAIPYEIKSNGKTEKDIEKLAKTSDMLELMLISLNIGDYVAKTYNYSKDWINTAIIDKIYVNKSFRRCGIASWIHNNIYDLINMYALVFPTAIVLSYGDFSDEAEKEFSMSREQYHKMLYRHYKNLGYRSIKHLPSYTKTSSTNVMFKLLIG